jgi:hypothetical protein
MWVQFYRNKRTIFGTHTNNHIESYHRAIKRVLSSHCNMFKYLFTQETEENIIKENTFLILNVSDHWILLTNFGCDSGNWHVYDSLYQSTYVFALNKMFNHFNLIYEDNDVFLVTHRDGKKFLLCHFFWTDF